MDKCRAANPHVVSQQSYNIHPVNLPAKTRASFQGNKFSRRELTPISELNMPTSADTIPHVE